MRCSSNSSAHRRAGADHLDTTQGRQRVHQRLERARIQGVGRRVERHGDRRFRGRHQIDRQSVLLEHREGVGQEADLVPHAERLHRQQRDAFLGADRLDARAAVAAGGGDHRPLESRLLGGVHRERDAIVLDRQNAARVQHLGAARGDLLCLVVVERSEQAGVRHGARVGREHARHVGPDLEPAGMQLGGEVGAGGVGAAAPEEHGLALTIARDESLREQHAAALSQALLQRRVGLEAAGGREVACARGGARALLGMQQRARIEPLGVEALAGEEGRADARRHEFARGHHPRAQTVAHLADQVNAGGHLAQLGEVVLELRADRDREVAREVAVTALDLRHHRFPVAGEGLREQLLEAIGDAGERRVDDDRPQALVEARTHDGRDVLPVADARYAGAAELEDDPVGVGTVGHRALPERRPGSGDGGAACRITRRRRRPSGPSAGASRRARLRACSTQPCPA